MAVFNNDKSNALISGTSSNDTIQNGGRWNDFWYSREYYHDGGLKVTISGGTGDDYIYNCREGKNTSISGGAGDDKIWNDADSVTISGGYGNDMISNGIEISKNTSINGGAGNDFIENECSNVTIKSGIGSDTIFNACYEWTYKGTQDCNGNPKSRPDKRHFDK